jgi:hypothetical protein
MIHGQQNIKVVLQVAMEHDDLNPRCCQDGEVKFAVHRHPFSWASTDLSRMMHCWVHVLLQPLAHHFTPLHGINAGDILYIHM